MSQRSALRPQSSQQPASRTQDTNSQDPGLSVQQPRPTSLAQDSGLELSAEDSAPRSQSTGVRKERPRPSTQCPAPRSQDSAPSLPGSTQSAIGRDSTKRISMLELAWIEPKCDRKGNHRADQHAQACLDRAKVQWVAKSLSGSACSSLPGSSQSAIGREITERITMCEPATVELAPECSECPECPEHVYEY